MENAQSRDKSNLTLIPYKIKNHLDENNNRKNPMGQQEDQYPE
jgi:hypothetical protein